ncbi:hypothetical protein HHI36_023603 [Cryptolaemus montrouzieri]|uniref:Uncharacterized protein n=1 Tax=Cryptolaemus montrouzieri TaxID=559131 RepID=A0ABD2PHE4_9CUCU
MEVISVPTAKKVSKKITCCSACSKSLHPSCAVRIACFVSPNLVEMAGTRGNDGSRSGRSSHVSVSDMSDVELDDPEILRIIEMEKNSSENHDPNTEPDMYYKKEEIDTKFGDILSELKTIKDETEKQSVLKIV